MKVATAVLLCFSLPLNSCSIAVEVRDGDVFFSFESGFDNWTARGTDVGAGGALNWSVTSSTQLARDGASSLRFELNNFSGEGKIWIERVFRVDSTRTRHVTVRFAFASADFGTVGNFRILAGVKRFRPEVGTDLTRLAQDDTGNGLTTQSSYQWMEKSYTLTIEPLPLNAAMVQGEFWVVIGVWGTSNSHRSYFVDNVRITIEES